MPSRLNSLAQRQPFAIRLSVFVLVSAVALILAFIIPSGEQSEKLFILFGYPSTFILFGNFVATILLHSRNSGCWSKSKLLSRQFIIPLLACVIAAWFLYTREGGGFKIPFDEQLLTNVSQNMHTHHLPVMSETTFDYLASYEMIDKRPLLFPFILSLVHGIIGYNSHNAFYLNFALTGLFLFLLFKTVERIHSRKAGYISILLASFMPIIAQNASGGGFEMLNLCLILIVSLLSMDYWKGPTLTGLTALLFATAAASNVRYESSIIILPVALLVITSWIRNKKPELPWLVIIIPLLFLPLVWQLRAIGVNPAGFQYQTDGDGTFSLSYLIPNLSKAYRYFFIPDPAYPGSPFIGFIGISGILTLGALALTRRKTVFKDHPDRVAFLATLLYGVLQMALIMCFFYGKLDQAITSRLGLPFILILFITGAIALAMLHDWKRSGRYAIYLFLLLSALYSFKMYSTARYTRSNTVLDNAEWATDFAKTLPKGHYLFITAMPKVFEIEGYNNISITRVNTNLEKLKYHLDIKTYREIYVIQSGKIRISGNTVEKEILNIHQLSPAVRLELIEEVSFATNNFVRLSRIVDIDMSLNVETKPIEKSEAEQYYTPNEEEVKRFSENLL